jgi:Domain of Unknown Function (DUF928)
MRLTEIMNLRKSIQLLAILTGLLAPGVAAYALESSVSPVSSERNGQISVNFPNTKAGAPVSTGGGGRRGNGCAARSQTPLTALMPKDQVGTTLDPNPTLYAYLPETNAQALELVVVDSKGNYVYSQEFDSPKSAGVIKLSLPKADPQGKSIALQADEVYWWELSMICDRNDRSSDTYVWGSLQRPTLDSQDRKNLEMELKRSNNPIEQAKVYAKYRMWNETLNSVMEVRNTRPNEWKELLNSVGIMEDKIIEAPFLGELK